MGHSLEHFVSNFLAEFRGQFKYFPVNRCPLIRVQLKCPLNDAFICSSSEIEGRQLGYLVGQAGPGYAEANVEHEFAHKFHLDLQRRLVLDIYQSVVQIKWGHSGQKIR